VKAVYYSHQLTDPGCRKEIARRTSEELSDIHLDVELNEACAVDVQHYCRDIPAGQGRVIQCLLMALKSTNTLITDSCRTRLMDRERLWQIASKEDNVVLPKDLGQFVQVVLNSENSTSLLTYFGMFIFIIFAGGLCFGRLSKRHRQLEHKVR